MPKYGIDKIISEMFLIQCDVTLIGNIMQTGLQPTFSINSKKRKM